MKEITSLMERCERAVASAAILLNEKDYDSSVSRAYYAMFYAAEALLLTRNLKFSSHKSVISLFGEHFVKTGIFKQEMGKRLSKTFEKRMVGDYSFTPQVEEEDAEEVLIWAQEFKQEVKKYLKIQGYVA